jgi:hypothetical protein
MDSSQQEQPADRLLQLITGHWVAAALYSAAKLRLADHLAEGPKSSDALAQAVKAHPDALYRLLRALCGLGVVAEGESKLFTLTDVGDLLRSDHPQSLRSFALFQGAPPHWRGWGTFLHSVQTGESAFRHAHGEGFFDYCQTDPEFSEAFNDAMTAMSATIAEAVLEAYDFNGIQKLVDVGGGHGYLLSAILTRYPDMQGGVFDLPHVVRGASEVIGGAGLESRCELYGGSFFESLPPADAYLAKHIIHDWDDEHSRKILSNMRAAMQGSGKVLLVEMVIRPDNRSTFATLVDLEMLHATHGGRERTEDEFRVLFASAGLKLRRVVETKSPFSVLEATPA